MDNVVNITGELELRKTVSRFARLLELTQEHEAKILENPLPYLAALETRYVRLRFAMEEALHALHGITAISPASSHEPLLPVDFTIVLLNRNKRAEDILTAAFEVE